MVSKRFRDISLQQLSIPTSNGVVTFSDKDGELAVILKKKNGEEKKIAFDLENKKIKASDLELDDGTSVKANTAVVGIDGIIKEELLPTVVPRKDEDNKIKKTDLPDSLSYKDDNGKIPISELPDDIPRKIDGKISDIDIPDAFIRSDSDGKIGPQFLPPSVPQYGQDGKLDESVIPSIIPRKTADGRLDVSDLPDSVITGDFDGLFDEKFGTKDVITGDFDDLFDTKFGTKGVITDSNIADRVSSNLPSNLITTLNISSNLPSSVVTDSNIGSKLPSNVITDSNIASKVSSNLPTSVVTTNNIADRLPSDLVYESGLSSLLQNSDATYGTVDATTVNVKTINLATNTPPSLNIEKGDIIVKYIDDGSYQGGAIRLLQNSENWGGIYFHKDTKKTDQSYNYTTRTSYYNVFWNIKMNAGSTQNPAGSEALIFRFKNVIRGYINSGTSPGGNLNNFTGQHRNISDDLDLYSSSSIGLIAVSNGEYNSTNSNSITINEALPKISLSNTRNQKNVFGVISNKEDEDKDNRTYEHGNFVSVFDKPADDNRLIVNSLGEGGIWVSNINGNLENGDYITTCEIPGYGMKQDDDLLHNYTVAKITCDCDFDLQSPIYICEEFEWEGQAYRRAFVGCTYHCG